MMATIQPYTILVSDAQIDDLKQRLSLARFPDELDEAGWDLGAPLTDIKRLTAYWKDEFDWREAEAKLNKLPQFTASVSVDGFAPLRMHFVHQKSSRPNAIPLLFVHGWPGSYLEVTKVLDKLTTGDDSDPSAPVFNVVAPSLPNFGWSEGPKTRGFAMAQYAESMDKLMQQLGYTEYVTQGGDWGYYITRALGILYPSRVRASHINMDYGDPPSWTTDPRLALEHALTPYTDRDRAGLARTKWFAEEGSGYRVLQSTKPQTLGYGLADSPVFLLSWIYEKLHDWTDAYPWTDAEICLWVSVYWFSTAGPAANVRVYYESVHALDYNKSGPRNRAVVTRDRSGNYIGAVKLGMSHSPKELRVLPNTWTRKQGPVVFERYHDSGGHFFAWEKPDHLVADVREMFGRKGGAFGVIKAKDGCGS